jgi:hypothetical protein
MVRRIDRCTCLTAIDPFGGKATTEDEEDYEASPYEIALAEAAERRAANPNPVYDCTELNFLHFNATRKGRDQREGIISKLKSLTLDSQLQWREFQYHGAHVGWDGEYKCLRSLDCESGS